MIALYATLTTFVADLRTRVPARAREDRGGPNIEWTVVVLIIFSVGILVVGGLIDLVGAVMSRSS